MACAFQLPQRPLSLRCCLSLRASVAAQAATAALCGGQKDCGSVSNVKSIPHRDTSKSGDCCISCSRNLGSFVKARSSSDCCGRSLGQTRISFPMPLCTSPSSATTSATTVCLLISKAVASSRSADCGNSNRLNEHTLQGGHCSDDDVDVRQCSCTSSQAYRKYESQQDVRKKKKSNNNGSFPKEFMRSSVATYMSYQQPRPEKHVQTAAWLWLLFSLILQLSTNGMFCIYSFSFFPATASAISGDTGEARADLHTNAVGSGLFLDKSVAAGAAPVAATPAPDSTAEIAGSQQVSAVELDALGLPVNKKVYRARLYGSMFSYAYYFLDILVGSPPQRASVILDTGSSLLAFPCVGCEDCGEHLDAAIDTSISTSGEWIDCRDRERCFGVCSDAQSQQQGGTPFMHSSRTDTSKRCMYTQMYSEGSSIKGIYFSDVVALGEVAQRNPFVRYDFVGCHTQETNLFVTQKAAGIFGISFPKGHRQPTLLDVMFEHSELINRKVFSICISEDGGLLSVGGLESSLLVAPPEPEPSSPAAIFPFPSNVMSEWPLRQPQGSLGAKRNVHSDSGPAAAEAIRNKTSPHFASLIGWMPIISHSTYRVALERMEVEGFVLGRSQEEFGNTMVDSGTTYSYFPPAVFGRWRQYLSRLCTPERFCETERDGRPCWRMPPGRTLSDVFPPIKVVFSSKTSAAVISSTSEEDDVIQDEDGSDEGATEQVVWWRPEGYLYRRTGGYFCDGLDDNHVDASVLGLSFFKNKLVIFDREKDRVGFAAAQCPSFVLEQRPPGPSTQILEAAPPVFANSLSNPAEVDFFADATDGENTQKQQKQKSHAASVSPLYVLSLTPLTVWLVAVFFVFSIICAMGFVISHAVKPHTSGVTNTSANSAAEDSGSNNRRRGLRSSNSGVAESTAPGAAVSAGGKVSAFLRQAALSTGIAKSWKLQQQHQRLPEYVDVEDARLCSYNNTFYDLGEDEEESVTTVHAAAGLWRGESEGFTGEQGCDIDFLRDSDEDKICKSECTLIDLPHYESVAYNSRGRNRITCSISSNAAVAAEGTTVETTASSTRGE